MMSMLPYLWDGGTVSAVSKTGRIARLPEQTFAGPACYAPSVAGALTGVDAAAAARLPGPAARARRAQRKVAAGAEDRPRTARRDGAGHLQRSDRIIDQIMSLAKED